MLLVRATLSDRILELSKCRQLSRGEQPSVAAAIRVGQVDRVTPQTRSKIMAAVRTKDTGAEKTVRSIVHRLGYRYSLRRADLPGRPDLVFVSRLKVIFVHGCFWHGHTCRYGRLPKSRLHYGQPKILANRARDRRQVARLKRDGWSVLTVWQCQLKNERILEARIKRFLDD